MRTKNIISDKIKKKNKLSSEERRKIHTQFIGALQIASRKNKGDLAILRRACGKLSRDAPEAMTIFYRYLPKDLYYSINEEIYFLIATLIGYNDYSFKGSFGKTMQVLSNRMTSTGTENKMMRLINSSFHLVDTYKPGGGTTSKYLSSCVRLAASYSVGVDWVQLSEDLIYWTHPEKFIQKRWIKDYYYRSLKNSQLNKNHNQKK